jgi:hypothetical protein
VDEPTPAKEEKKAEEPAQVANAEPVEAEAAT